jgi:cobalt-precorrin 5A hydrolase
MKMAIISLTTPGHKLAQEISRNLEEDHTVLRMDLFHKNVAETLKSIITQYDCILGIMASGILVRGICPLIQTKIQDPAVLVMDENGQQVISLLSGHLGGGNDYAIKIASIMGADPVITTATDVQGKMGVDSLARRYHLHLDDPKKIKILNQALVEGKEVELALSNNLEYILEDEQVRKSYRISKKSCKTSKISSSPLIEATFNDNKTFNDTKIILTPEKLVVGVGARKGVSGEFVLRAVKEALLALELPLERIDSLATAEPKQDEKGILEAADILGRPLEIISLKDIKEFEHPDCSQSLVVKKPLVWGVFVNPLLY